SGLSALLSASALVLAASAPAAAPQLTAGIAPAQVEEHVKVLASDAFEGRAPATKGEEKTIAYISEQMAKAGVKPGGEGGGWYQPVPMIESTVAPAPLAITGGSAPISLAYGEDQVVWTKRVRDRVSVENADLVFVGYGIDAPE